jgi:hypothetical protein
VLPDPTYNDAAAHLHNLNTTLEELGLNTTAIIDRHNGTSGLATIQAGGERVEVATGLTARQLVATIRMVERVTRHAVALARKETPCS